MFNYDLRSSYYYHNTNTISTPPITITIRRVYDNDKKDDTIKKANIKYFYPLYLFLFKL